MGGFADLAMEYSESKAVLFSASAFSEIMDILPTKRL